MAVLAMVILLLTGCGTMGPYVGYVAATDEDATRVANGGFSEEAVAQIAIVQNPRINGGKLSVEALKEIQFLSMSCQGQVGAQAAGPLQAVGTGGGNWLRCRWCWHRDSRPSCVPQEQYRGKQLRSFWPFRAHCGRGERCSERLCHGELQSRRRHRLVHNAILGGRAQGRRKRGLPGDENRHLAIRQARRWLAPASTQPRRP